MIVGFLRKKNTPPKLARLLSYTCNYHGISLIYMTPEGINMTKGTVQGKMLINNAWERTEVPLPKYIDITPYLFTYKKYSKLTEYLKANTKLSINRGNIMQKDILQETLINHERLHKYAIPGENIDTFEKFLDFIMLNQKVVVKPVNGLQGKSVIVLQAINENLFVIGEQKSEKQYTKDELKDLFTTVFKKSRYVVQKYITSRTKHNDPFDCRVHMEKGANNRWNIANIFVRIGIGQTVVSNVNQGGGISKLTSFLEVNYAEKSKEIEEHLKRMAMDMASEMERITDTQLSTMGLDVGISPEGNLYVFEINSLPIVSPQLAEVTLLRAQYYKYMLENNEKKNYKNKQNHISELRIEIKELKDRLKQIESSTSWKVTKPIRAIGKRIKK